MPMPSEFNDFVSKLKYDPSNRKALVSEALGISVSHYDKSVSHGYIDRDRQQAYRLVYSAPKDAEVKYNICGPSHQLIADALNMAGVKARVATFGAARAQPDEIGGNHIALIYKSADDEYTINDWDDAETYKADNIIDAYKKASAKHVSLMDPGISSIATADGKNVAYSEITIGDKLAENPDENSIDKFNKKLEQIETSKNELTGSLKGKRGTDELGQNYRSQTTQLNVSKNFKFDAGELQLDAEGSTSHLLVTSNPTPNLSKRVNYNVLDGDVSGTLKSNPITKNNTSTQAFLSSSVHGTEVKRDGTNKQTIKTPARDIKLFGLIPMHFPASESTSEYKSSGNFSTAQAENIIGTTTKIENSNTETKATIFTGLRLSAGGDVFEQKTKLRPSLITGAKIQSSTTLPIGETSLNIEGKASAIKVDSKYYNENLLAAEGKATIGEKNRFSLYGGLEQKSIDLTETGDKAENTQKYLGAQYQRDFNNFTLGIDGKTTAAEGQKLGDNFSVNTHVSF